MPEDGPDTANRELESAPPASKDAQPLPSNPDHDEYDDFGLPIRKAPKRTWTNHEEPQNDEAEESSLDRETQHEPALDTEPHQNLDQSHTSTEQEPDLSSGQQPSASLDAAPVIEDRQHDIIQGTSKEIPEEPGLADQTIGKEPTETAPVAQPSEQPATAFNATTTAIAQDRAKSAVIASQSDAVGHAGPSEWSHMRVTSSAKKEEAPTETDDWQEMPTYATHTVYDDWGKVVAREIAELDEEEAAYGHLGGAGKGYTKIQLDDDAQSATSMDEDTAYLFKAGAAPNTLVEDEEERDILSQMQATKDLLTEGQRIAYVGLVRLSMMGMINDLERLERTKSAKKFLETATESMQMWSQKMMLRLYSHMEIDSAEQIMIEQLAQHGVEPADLTPTLMQNARVKNPVAQNASANASRESLSQPSKTTEADSSSLHATEAEPPTTTTTAESGAKPESTLTAHDQQSKASKDTTSSGSSTPGLPPAYEEENPPDYLTLQDPEDLAKDKNIDIDLRWTVLCDLFLVLIADSVYDSRSRTLLEHVGSSLSVPWVDICRFEKRITDALEMQEAADKENWNEDEHLDQRKKSARNRRLVMMGVATVGGGLLIGLSAGLLAPVIGAGLAAGFTTIGVAGTSGFLAGAGGAAIITSTGALAGGTIAVRASNRRTGAVKTFEYRPLYNNKRVNLIVTVAGWMTGKVDDVRLPFSTVDPIMGDMYSVFWEPEMLRSMGDTINILATEALTQGLQQILGSTVLIALMSAMQLPLVLTKLSYLIDNPWSVSLARADLAGLILADSLIDRNLGVRPITLVGFSIGSRVIFSCLKELANRGAFGIIQNVYLFGSPMVVKTDEYLRAKAVVSGRFVNGYALNDWILGYLFRATGGGIMRVAGLAPVDIPGIENYDVTKLVPGHMAYRQAMPKLLREVGWLVDSDEFAEIEDPDPENHDQRQRELINEIEEARRALEKKPEKKGLKALFTRNKKNAERKAWEVYEEQAKAESSENAATKGTSTDPNANVLFDIDAIRAEVADLATQGIEVREIKSTLPPMRLNMDKASPSAVNNGLTSPRFGLRQTKSYSGLKDLNAGSTSSSSSGTGVRSTSNGWGKAARPSSPLAPSSPTMTFEPDRPSPVLSGRDAQRPSPLGLSPLPSNIPSPLPSPLSTPSVSQHQQQRPPLYSSSTMPSGVSVSVANVERNAWADEEEEDFGQEREMEMTFE